MGPTNLLYDKEPKLQNRAARITFRVSHGSSARGLTEKMCWETLATCGTKQKATLMFKALKEPAHSYKQNLITACHTKYNLLNSYWSLLKLSHPNEVQWNLDLMKCQGTGEICSLYRKPRLNEFLGKQAKCWLYRGIIYYTSKLQFPTPSIFGYDQFL